MSAPSTLCPGKRLYLADLARRAEAMEDGSFCMSAVAYRLVARRMSAGMAGYPAALIATQLGGEHPSILHALAQRHFDDHGWFEGEAGRRAFVTAAALIARLSLPKPGDLPARSARLRAARARIRAKR